MNYKKLVNSVATIAAFTILSLGLVNTAHATSVFGVGKVCKVLYEPASVNGINYIQVYLRADGNCSLNNYDFASTYYGVGSNFPNANPNLILSDVRMQSVLQMANQAVVSGQVCSAAYFDGDIQYGYNLSCSAPVPAPSPVPVPSPSPTPAQQYSKQ